VLNKDFMEESPDDDKFLPLLEDLSDFKFEYFQEGESEEEAGEWLGSWDGKDKKELPREVRMTVQWKEKKGKKEEVEMSLPALVSIPAIASMIVRGGPSLRFEGRVLARLPSKETVLLRRKWI